MTDSPTHAASRTGARGLRLIQFVSIAALLYAFGALAPAIAVTPMVALGSQHSCVLTSSGGVKCWGSNWTGELGDNTQIERYAPIDVAGLAGIKAVSAGYGHTCAVTSGGGVKCWGYNSDGQLGNNSGALVKTPTDVAGLSSGLLSVTAGAFHTCAVMTTGGVKCWGRNEHGELGNGGTSQSSIPVDVIALGATVTAAVAGSGYTCALTGGGAVMCWGRNDQGQLGTGTLVESHAPIAVAGLASGVTALSTGGAHTCALTSGGGLKCWGANSFGQLGDNSTTQRETPVKVSGLSSGVTGVAAGGGHTCALLGGGAVKCWGANNFRQLGNGSTLASLVPVDVIGLAATATAIAAGSTHTCVLTGSGGVKCWGWNYPGQLGNSSILRTVPTGVTGLASGMMDVTAGSGHSCARSNGGALKCWGYGGGGALGDATGEDHPTPVDVVALPLGASMVTAGSSHTCAVSGGGAKCWGRNTYGQLGDNSKIDRLEPTDVSGLSTGIAAMAAGGKHSCALTSAGGVKCWGLDRATNLEQLTPLDIVGLGDGVTSLSAGYLHTCAVTGVGGVKCWGDNSVGELGDNSNAQRTTPVDVVGLDNVTTVTVGEAHTCALTSAGGVKCWGYNSDGQLGDDSTTDRWAPVDVVGLSSGAVALAGGGMHTCAVMVGGAMRCWGGNSIGQLGDGTIIRRLTPVDVIGLGSGATAIAAGYLHTCAVVAGGAVQCWGDARAGQLGDGTLDLYGPASFVVDLNLLGGPTLESSANPSITGQSLTFTATVSGLDPTGTVTFRDGAATIAGCAAVTLTAGQAQCPLPAQPIGSRLITASYSGDADNPGATSDPMIQQTTSALDIDDNGVVDALTDGLLLIRHQFGLTGSALTAGAIGPGAQRTDSMAIAGFVAGAGPILDIDGDGHVDALTDGILVLRYLFGLRGGALIQDAVAIGALRKTAQEIATRVRFLSEI